MDHIVNEGGGYMKYSIPIFALLISIFLVGCAGIPATWKALPEIKETEYEEAWSIIVGAVSEKFDLAVVDGNSGYLRSAWKVKKGFFGDKESQSRAVVRVVSRKPFKIKLKVEKQTWNGFTEDWQDAGNDEKFESQLLEELQARLK